MSEIKNFADNQSQYHIDKAQTAFSNEAILGKDLYAQQDLSLQEILDRFGITNRSIIPMISGILGKEDIPSEEKLKQVLDYLETATSGTDSVQWNEKALVNFQSWRTETVEKGEKEFAASWLATPQQAMQMAAVLEATKARDILRLGTASAHHAEQLAILMDTTANDITDKTLSIVDTVNLPLDQVNEKKHLFTKRNVDVKTQQMDVLDMNNEEALKFVPNESQDMVTSHFIMGGIPTATQFETEKMTREQALELKQQVFENAYAKLREGGTLAFGIGTSAEERRFHTKEEIQQYLEKAGFESSKISIHATTDTMDDKDGKLIPGNFFVTAVK